MFALPDSVLTYLTDPKIRTAADLMLAKRRPAIPATVGWPDMAQFYRATLSVRQLQYDFATTLLELWQTVWKTPLGWSAIEPSRQSDAAPLDLETVWSKKFFSREFERPHGLRCELLVYADEGAGFQIAIGVWRRSKTALSVASLDDWEYDDEYCWTEERLVKPCKVLELSELKLAAEDALVLLAEIH